jgi:hypothetical protein
MSAPPEVAQRAKAVPGPCSVSWKKRAPPDGLNELTQMNIGRMPIVPLRHVERS